MSFQDRYNINMEKKIKRSSRSIQPVVKISSLSESKSDFEFWQSQPYIVRLSTLEEIRAEYHGWRGNVQPRLQKVYSIIKR